ncbi:MAG TPA: hypothetical protein VGW38_29570 [Chloroflexota bacterium]|nr:hypothetical protein [Chloroflexota bacterium]
MSETTLPRTKQCACAEHVDARTCIELRYFGRSPVLRRGQEDPYQPEDEFLVVDMGMDERCECVCHYDEEYDDDYDY